MSWITVIIMAVALGIWTALMAMLVPDGNSFHDIAVTPEWWVLPAVLIIVNCKKPLDAALKVFVFFLISQPLVYLIQVPFNSMGWGLFQFYPYWFKITLITLPAGFVGWFIRKDEWYSGIILSAMTILLGVTAINYAGGFKDSFPNHLITVIYCIVTILLFIFGILRKMWPRIIAITITAITLIIFVIVKNPATGNFTTYNSTFIAENGIELVGAPKITNISQNTKCPEAECVKIVGEVDGAYSFMLSGEEGGEYRFTIEDEAKNEYEFKYWLDKAEVTIKVELVK